jgi:hypothetical protein
VRGRLGRLAARVAALGHQAPPAEPLTLEVHLVEFVADGEPMRTTGRDIISPGKPTRRERAIYDEHGAVTFVPLGGGEVAEPPAPDGSSAAIADRSPSENAHPAEAGSCISVAEPNERNTA